MTGRVNVPLEMISAVMKVAVGMDEYGSEVFPGPSVAAELVEAMLASAPKAEPSASVDYWHEELGGMKAGKALYEGQQEYVKREDYDALRAQPEAPKVEREPAVIIHLEENFTAFGSFPVLASWKNNARLPAGKHKLYTHPAPANDELLEAIAKDAAERVHKNGGCVPQLAYAPVLFALQDGFAKHKGPQS